jgi:hypothetical protein
MSGLQPFSVLVGDIYDAALDPSLWPSVLEKICGFVPAAYGNIFIQDAVNRHANSVFTWGVDPEHFRAYLETYAKINPLFPATLFQRVGEVWSVFEVMPEAQFERTRFFREWVLPQGLVDNVAVILEKSATSCAMLALPRTAKEGLLTDDCRGLRRHDRCHHHRDLSGRCEGARRPCQSWWPCPPGGGRRSSWVERLSARP